MNKVKIIQIFFLMLLVGITTVNAAGNHLDVVAYYEAEELSQAEIDGIMLMREEEKLARDVYYELYDIWGQNIFYNIGSSEEQHMEAMLKLIEKYNLTDPVGIDERGVFEDQHLQELYDALVAQGSQSLADAYMMGAKIEELDIKDLQELREVSDNLDILAVYQNLEKGSRNHLKSFDKKVESTGNSYKAEFISQEEYDTIAAAPKENGVVYGSYGETLEQMSEEELAQAQAQKHDDLGRMNVTGYDSPSEDMQVQNQVTHGKGQGQQAQLNEGKGIQGQGGNANAPQRQLEEQQEIEQSLEVGEQNGFMNFFRSLFSFFG